MDDLEYPRVSEILDLIDWGYDKTFPKDVLNKLAKYGTGLHNVISKTTTGEKTRVQAKYSQRLTSLTEWMEEKGYKTLFSEVPIKYVYEHLSGEKRGFQGTLDSIVQTKSGIEIWDWKTGKFNKRHILQVNAYNLAYGGMNNMPLRTRLVSPKKDRVEDFVCPDMREEFLNLVNLYYYVKLR